MSIKKIFSVLVFIIVLANVSKAQPFETGIGFRLGGITSGITVKHFTGSATALEGIVSFGRRAFLITGLYEKHNPFGKAEGLSWFYGGGAHIGLFTNNYPYENFYYHSHGKKVRVNEFEDGKISFGGDFIIGMDYKFKNTPVNLSLDVKPFIDIVPGVYGYWEGALSIRFTL